MRPASCPRLPPLLAAAWSAWTALGIPQAAEADAPAGAAEEDGAARGGLDLDARLYVLGRLTDESDAPTNEFGIESARIQVAWRRAGLLEAVVEIEAGEASLGEDAFGILRDAYVALTPLARLEIRAGQFKRAFSRLELTSPGRLPTIGRGIANRWIVGDLAYGDRDVGLELSGRLWEDARLDYAVGVYDGSGAGVAEGGAGGFKDFSARLDARPLRWLSIGADVSLKALEDGDLASLIDPAIFAGVDPAEFPLGYDEDELRAEHAWMTGVSWMAGFDVGVRVAGLRVLAEASVGENWWFEGRPLTATTTLMASYDIELLDDPSIRLEPVVRGAFVLPRTGETGTRAWEAVAGVNLHLWDCVRLMIDGAFVRVEGPEPDEVRRNGLWPGEWPGAWEDLNRMDVQLAFDL